MASWSENIRNAKRYISLSLSASNFLLVFGWGTDAAWLNELTGKVAKKLNEAVAAAKFGVNL